MRPYAMDMHLGRTGFEILTIEQHKIKAIEWMFSEEGRHCMRHNCTATDMGVVGDCDIEKAKLAERGATKARQMVSQARGAV